MSKLFAQLRCLFLIGLVSVSGIAGGALAVAPIFAAQDNITGLPLAGGLLYTYASGTNTYLPVYTSAALTTQMPQPIVLNNYGEAQFWLGSSAYRFNLVNAAGVQQSPYPIDNIQANASMTNLASTVAGSDGAGQIGYTLGSHSANTVGSALDTAAALETALPLNTLATNGAGLMGWASTNAYAAGTAGAGLNTLNVFDTNLGLSTLASNGAGLVGYSSGNSYTTGTVGYALNNFSIGSNFNKVNFNLYTDASPALGDMWTDTTQQTLCVNEGSSTANLVKVYKGGAIASNKQQYSVTCTTAGTFYDILAVSNFIGTTTIPANFFVPGKTLKIEADIVVTPTAGSCALNLAFYFGATQFTDSLATQPALFVATNLFHLSATISCTATTQLTLSGYGIGFVLGSGSPFIPLTQNNGSGPQSMTLNASAVLDIKASLSAGSSGTIVVNNLTISVLD